jgi:hypothetical protein
MMVTIIVIIIIMVTDWYYVSELRPPVGILFTPG